jgi:Cys-tRNA(Pro)/Cys-tRNA(Cys) deacylase
VGKGGRTAGAAVPSSAVGVVTGAGVAHRLHRYIHDPAAPSYGDEAATVLGVDPARVHKTLVAAVDDRLVVAVVPVAGQLDLKALGATCGGRRAVMAATVAARGVGRCWTFRTGPVRFVCRESPAAR